MIRCKRVWVLVFYFSLVIFFSGMSATCVFAGELYINVLAVNGTDQPRDKEIKQGLPKELKAEDILDTDILKLEYDANAGLYYVTGKVSLDAKETKTYKVRVKDLWQIDQSDVNEVKKRMDSNVSNLKETEYFEKAQLKKDALNKRLDFIVSQSKSTESIEKRIDLYRTYEKEMRSIRDNALNAKYWRTSPELEKTEDLVYAVVGLKNTTQQQRKTNAQQYLPAEVKPENVVDLNGFDMRFDQDKQQSYLVKEEELAPGESKEYKIGIHNVWKIPQNKIDDLKDRSRGAYKFLEGTKYSETADYLVKNIKEKIESVEASQKIERNIEEHISAFRANSRDYELAKKDVATLEDLLQVVREDLERSRLKNVLQKIKALQSIADIAQNLFKKVAKSAAFKVILFIIGFVGLFTVVHFAIWGVRSRKAKLEDIDKAKEETENQEKK